MHSFLLMLFGASLILIAGLLIGYLNARMSNCVKDEEDYKSQILFPIGFALIMIFAVTALLLFVMGL